MVKTLHRTKSHVSVFLKRDGNMQLHVSVMFNMHKKWSGSVVYAATETRENVTKPVTETGYPSCFQNGLTCFCHVSVYGFLQFRPVLREALYIAKEIFSKKNTSLVKDSEVQLNLRLS